MGGGALISLLKAILTTVIAKRNSNYVPSPLWTEELAHASLTKSFQTLLKGWQQDIRVDDVIVIVHCLFMFSD